MELKNEKESMFHQFELDISDEEAKQLRDIGLKEIEKDDNELINYAINNILRKMVEKEELREKLTENVKKSKKLTKSLNNTEKDKIDAS